MGCPVGCPVGCPLGWPVGLPVGWPVGLPVGWPVVELVVYVSVCVVNKERKAKKREISLWSC